MSFRQRDMENTDKPVAIYPGNHKIKGILRNKAYNSNELYSFSRFGLQFEFPASLSSNDLTIFRVCNVWVWWLSPHSTPRDIFTVMSLSFLENPREPTAMQPS